MCASLLFLKLKQTVQIPLIALIGCSAQLLDPPEAGWLAVVD
jgi:hypothetical protein